MEYDFFHRAPHHPLHTALLHQQAWHSAFGFGKKLHEGPAHNTTTAHKTNLDRKFAVVVVSFVAIHCPVDSPAQALIISNRHQPNPHKFPPPFKKRYNDFSCRRDFFHKRTRKTTDVQLLEYYTTVTQKDTPPVKNEIQNETLKERSIAQWLPTLSLPSPAAAAKVL